MSFLADVSRSIQSTIIVNTSLSQLKNLRLRSHNERFLTFLPGQILFSYQPKNILAYFFAKIENQNLLSLALTTHALTANGANIMFVHKNKDMFFCVQVSWFSNKVNASHNHLTDFFFKKTGWTIATFVCLCICVMKRWLTPLFCPLQRQHPLRLQWKVNAWARCILRYNHLNEHFEPQASL